MRPRPDPASGRRTTRRRQRRRVAVCVATACLTVLVGCRSTVEPAPASEPVPSSPTASSPAASSPAASSPTARSPAASATAGSAVAPAADAGVTTCTVPARLRGRDLEVLPVSERVVALTFDAGASSAGVPSILGTLRGRGARATFFLTGQFTRTFPVRSARIAEEHMVGNHTDTHADLTRLSDDAVRRQVRAAERSILQITGEDPRRFFRFPFGARNAHAIDLVNGLCYVPFRWTVDTLGWRGTSGGQSVQTVVDRVLAGARPGAIVLMHVGANPDDGSTLDADALPRVIRELRQRGYRLVRLSRIMSWAP